MIELIFWLRDEIENKSTWDDWDDGYLAALDDVLKKAEAILSDS